MSDTQFYIYYIYIAVPNDFYPSIPTNLLKGKVVVDVSNRATIRRDCTE